MYLHVHTGSEGRVAHMNISDIRSLTGARLAQTRRTLAEEGIKVQLIVMQGPEAQ
jgi:hypothetical protein